MHAAELINSLNAHNVISVPVSNNVKFNANQTVGTDARLAPILAQKNAEQKFHFGIEINSNMLKEHHVLDYSIFDLVLPLFTSIVWLGHIYANIEPIENVNAVRLAKHLMQRMPVLTHISVYRLSEARLQQLLALNNMANILAVRGDLIDQQQQYKYALELVTAARKHRPNDTLSIAVAGYPECHPDTTQQADDLQFLHKKINAGADFIITQICFRDQAIINYVLKVRSLGITAPMLVGILLVPNKRTLETMLNIAKVRMDDEELLHVRSLDAKAFRLYFIERAAQTIQTIMAANVGIYGFQFFSMNDFNAVQAVLQKLNLSNETVN